MILIYIAALISMLSFGAFGISYQLNGINRSVICLPISILENTAIIDEKTDIPYLDKVEVRNHLTYYYDCHIKKYTTDYKVEFYFYNSLDDAYCTDRMCNAVEVTIKANLMYNYKYERVMYYKISGDLNG